MSVTMIGLGDMGSALAHRTLAVRGRAGFGENVNPLGSGSRPVLPG
jgi:3-hydroxyisobutyrate dehydrogenase-like beta-hydroxyacid dehydrogenase